MAEAAAPCSGFAATRERLANPNVGGATPAPRGTTRADVHRGDGTHPRLVCCSECSSLTGRLAGTEGGPLPLFVALSRPRDRRVRPQYVRAPRGIDAEPFPPG